MDEVGKSAGAASMEIVEAIIGDLVRRGRKSSITAPLVAVACIHLLVYQNRGASAQQATPSGTGGTGLPRASA